MHGQSGQGTSGAPAGPIPPAQPPAPVVLIDAAHGGTDDGALLNPAIPEKDVTLMFAQRLQHQLETRGVSVALVRQGDATISNDQRAALANSAKPALYLSIHASSLGSGMRIFSAMLPAAGQNSGPFVSWDTAESASATLTSRAEQQIAASVGKSAIHVRALTAPLQPLNNIQAPALAIEIAPANGNVMQLASTDYQDTVSSALANAVASLVPSLRSPSFQPGGGKAPSP